MQKNKKKVPSGKHAGKLLFIRDFLLWTFGAALYSIGVASFTTPSKFVAGGVTGLAVLVNHLVPFITTGMVVIAVNIPLFILAWRKFGLRFIARTVAATVTVSLVIDFIDTCDLLIIDDLGTEASNNVSVADIFHCINKRILEKRSTIISTNLELQQIQKVYSDRLASRILGNYQIIKFYGEDLRLRHLRR